MTDEQLDKFIEAATGFPVNKDPRAREVLEEQRRRFRAALQTLHTATCALCRGIGSELHYDGDGWERCSQCSGRGTVEVSL